MYPTLLLPTHLRGVKDVFSIIHGKVITVHVREPQKRVVQQL